MNDITTEQLADWIDGRLDAAQAAQIEAALAQALPDTQARAAWLAEFKQWRASVQLPAPPPAVRAALQARFAERFARHAAPQVNRWQRLVGALQFDSWTRGAAALGARDASLETRTRQLFFGSEQLDITLQLARTPVGITLTGQLLPNDGSAPEPFAVQLLSADESQELALTRSDALGEFTLTAPHVTDTILLISGAAFEVAVPLPATQA